MDITYTAEVNIEKSFDEDKSPKDRCVESAMDCICDFKDSRYEGKFCTVIEQQLRRAWNEGYKYAYGTCYKNAAEQITAKELVAEDAKNEGRKEVWDMARRLYLTDIVENAYGYNELKKIFGTFSYSEILQKDVHEVFAKDNERLKRIEEEKNIRPGDEVEISKAWLPGIHYGWVADIHGNTVNVLMNTSRGVEMRYIHIESCRKTGNTAEHLAQLIKAMKEER